MHVDPILLLVTSLKPRPTWATASVSPMMGEHGAPVLNLAAVAGSGWAPHLRVDSMAKVRKVNIRNKISSKNIYKNILQLWLL